MKYWLFCFAALSLFLFNACEEGCETSSRELVGDEFFTIEYKTSDGKNYLNEIYNLANVLVYLDTTGGMDPTPEFELIEPGYAGGKVGPFGFTERYINQARNEVNDVLLYGQAFNFDYMIRKDTYGQDTLTVRFQLGVDFCNTFWQEISYHLNGVELTDYRNQQNPEIVIVE